MISLPSWEEVVMPLKRAFRVSLDSAFPGCSSALAVAHCVRPVLAYLE